eukprot:scaffold2362_cov175-Prasinococcus_capsulatus_cf.AAC.1
MGKPGAIQPMRVLWSGWTEGTASLMMIVHAMDLALPGRSTRVPAWPFLTASFAFGCFALLPYFALWEP